MLAYKSAEVMQLARKFDLRALKKLARECYQALELQHPDIQKKGGWASQMPTWRSRTHARGLLGWGETRKKKADGTMAIITRKNGVGELCRHPILKALDFYFNNIGVPPVVAGVPLRKALRNSEFDREGHPATSRRGHTRGQQRLVKMQPPLGEECDNLEPFLLVVSAAYCTFLDPQVEDGTTSSSAVLGFLKEKKVLLKLLGNFKVRINRVTNRTWLSKCVNSLHGWVREGDVETRLKVIRALGDPGDVQLPVEGEPVKSMDTLVRKMSFYVVNALVAVSAGRESNEQNKYGFFPFGKQAGISTKAFIKLPDAVFSMALAEIYPFVAREKSKWEIMLKRCDHPMTGLWPWGKLKRHMTFRSRWRVNRKELFEMYNENGGEFHGSESTQYLVGNKKKRGKQQMADTETGDEDSMDDDFDS